MDATLAKYKQEADEAYEIMTEAWGKFATRPTPSGQKKIRYYTLDFNAKKNKLAQRIIDYKFIGGTNGKD